jgi:hypothetical protein
MNTKYEASVSPSALADACFQSVKGLDVTAVNPANLVADSSAVPYEANQEIFKNLSLAWWVQGLNAGTVQYRPVSNEVNWAFVNSEGKDVNIAKEITDVIIPNRTASVIRDADTKTMRWILEDNGCLLMTRVDAMFF